MKQWRAGRALAKHHRIGGHQAADRQLNTLEAKLLLEQRGIEHMNIRCRHAAFDDIAGGLGSFCSSNRQGDIDPHVRMPIKHDRHAIANGRQLTDSQGQSVGRQHECLRLVVLRFDRPLRRRE